MTTTNERILFMINHFCEGNKAKFAKLMGEKPQTINGWLNRKNGNGVLNKILDKFPMVNPAWLYTGAGEMLCEEPKTYNQTQPHTTIVMESAAPYGEPDEEEVNITEADTIIAMQRMMEIDRVRKMLIAEKDREIEALTKELEFWKAKANKLEYELSKTKTDTDTLQQEKAV